MRILGLRVLHSKVRQPGTYQYKIENIEHEQIWEKEVQVLYEEAMRDGVLEKGDFAYPNMLPFKNYLDHGGHNGTHIYDADTSDADGQDPGQPGGKGPDAADVQICHIVDSRL